jgi:tetratricopeptide (TPR) repeat protein
VDGSAGDASRTVPEAADGPRQDPQDDPLLPRGSLVGRYLVLGPLGSGGMGVVYAAYDPELDRRVALKLVHPRRAGAARADEGLLREARAVARLSHPNVVHIHDVGEARGRCFIAMELVDGGDLGQWLATARGWRAVVGVFAAAGRGLAAAHAAGLVHRDFKPANVRVGRDGRVVVLDFGLARAAGEGDAGVAGTPRYMAPETHRGGEATASADQYAYCVALAEALQGAPPFADASAAALEAAKSAGPRLSPRFAGPRWLRAIVLRGLDPAPARRFPDMPALLDALEGAPRSRRARAAAAAAVLVGAAAAVLLRAPAPAPALCRDGAARAAAVWSDGRAVRVAAAAPASERRAWAEARRQVDAYVARWAGAYDRACADARALGSPALLRRQGECLERRLGELDELLRQLERPGSSSGPLAAVAALTPVDRCDAAALGPAPPDAAADAAALAEARARLTEAEALERTGRYALARAAADGALARARGLGHDGLVAEAALRRGSVLEYMGAHAEAERALTEAFEVAQRAGHDRAAFEAAALAVFVVGTGAGDLRRAETWHAVARGALGRVPAAALDHARLRGYWAAALMTAGRLEEAQRVYAEVAAVQAARLGARHVDTLDTRQSRTDALRRLRRYDAALAEGRAALADRIAVFGPEHPEVAGMHNTLGVILVSQGDVAGAEVELTRALELRRRLLGDDSPRALNSEHNLAAVRLVAEDYAGAAALLSRVVARMRAASPSDGGALARALELLAQVRLRQAALPAAEAAAREALELRAQALGADHASLVPALHALVEVALADGRVDAGRELLRRADERLAQADAADPLARARGRLLAGELARRGGAPAAARPAYFEALATLARAGVDEPGLSARALLGLGEAELALGRAEAAARHLEQAEAHAQRRGVDRGTRGEVSFARARAYARLDGRRAEAAELARRSVALLAAAAPAYAATLRAAEGWGR